MNPISFISFIVIFVSCIASLSGDEQENFRKYKAAYGKAYSSPQEEKARYATFLQNKAAIEQHNRDPNALYTLTQNRFTDLTLKEFRSIYLGVKIPPATKKRIVKFENSKRQANPPIVDWTKVTGYVRPVKNQGACGSCWAFAAIASLEGQWFKKTGKSIDLSEQQLTSCVYPVNGIHGCMGGLMITAFNYIRTVGGVQNSSTYPYTSTRNVRPERCNFKKPLVNAKVTGFINLYTETELENAVASIGPISVAVAGDSFQNYGKGILNKCTGGVNHGVAVVGYNNTNDPPFWIVKNSFGARWGEAGYIRLLKGVDLCQITYDISYPTV